MPTTKLKQQTIADAAGVSHPTVWRLFNDRTVTDDAYDKIRAGLVALGIDDPDAYIAAQRALPSQNRHGRPLSGTPPRTEAEKREHRRVKQAQYRAGRALVREGEAHGWTEDLMVAWLDHTYPAQKPWRIAHLFTRSVHYHRRGGTPAVAQRDALEALRAALADPEQLQVAEGAPHPT